MDLCAVPLLSALFAGCTPPMPLATGYVEGEYVQIAPVSTAQLLNLTAAAGDRVEAGQPLVALEKRDAEISLAQAEAALSRASARHRMWCAAGWRQKPRAWSAGPRWPKASKSACPAPSALRPPGPESRGRFRGRWPRSHRTWSGHGPPAWPDRPRPASRVPTRIAARVRRPARVSALRPGCASGSRPGSARPSSPRVSAGSAPSGNRIPPPRPRCPPAALPRATAPRHSSAGFAHRSAPVRDRCRA